MSIRLAASKNNIVKSMLHSYAKRESENKGYVIIVSFKNRQIFTDTMEGELAYYILKSSEMFQRLITASIQCLVYECAIDNIHSGS